jgi:hypothetical protein
MKESAINPAAAPSGTECRECLEEHGWWLHLRRCAQCGHIGCCDSSPKRHARAHFHSAKHPVIASFEPGEAWFYDYPSEAFVQGAELAAPRWHPADQPVPGGNVPRDWQSKLHA